MTTAEIREIGAKLQSIADDMDRTPIPEGAPLLYEESCIEIYGPPDHHGGDPLYLHHKCRNDLGTVMIKSYSPIHTALQEVINE